METDDLPDGLAYVQDKPDHGVIFATHLIDEDAFNELLASTGPLWRKVE